MDSISDTVFTLFLMLFILVQKVVKRSCVLSRHDFVKGRVSARKIRLMQNVISQFRPYQWQLCNRHNHNPHHHYYRSVPSTMANPTDHGKIICNFSKILLLCHKTFCKFTNNSYLFLRSSSLLRLSINLTNCCWANRTACGHKTVVSMTGLGILVTLGAWPKSKIEPAVSRARLMTLTGTCNQPHHRTLTLNTLHPAKMTDNGRGSSSLGDKPLLPTDSWDVLLWPTACEMYDKMWSL